MRELIILVCIFGLWLSFALELRRSSYHSQGEYFTFKRKGVDVVALENSANQPQNAPTFNPANILLASITSPSVRLPVVSSMSPSLSLGGGAQTPTVEVQNMMIQFDVAQVRITYYSYVLLLYIQARIQIFYFVSCAVCALVSGDLSR